MFSIHVDVYHHFPRSDDEGRLARIEELLMTLILKGNAMSLELDALTQEVARNTSVDDSAILLLTSLADLIISMKQDPVALQKLADDLKASSTKLADAVVAHTPAAPL